MPLQEAQREFCSWLLERSRPAESGACASVRRRAAHENDQVRVTALRKLHPPIAESYALKSEIKGGRPSFFRRYRLFLAFGEVCGWADYLVLAHFVPGGIPTLTDQACLGGMRKHFDGNAIVGRDQLEILLQ